MRLIIIFICAIALCCADEDTQESDTGVFPEDIQEFVRRLTHQQMQTTQNMQNPLLPRMNLPLFGPRLESSKSEQDSPLSHLNFPFQSSSGSEAGGARSYAASSVSMKRPYNTGTNVEAQAAAFASVRDVDEEEHMGERQSTYDKASTTAEYTKKTPVSQEEVSNTVNGDGVTKGEPYALKHQQLETVQIKSDDSFSDVYFVAIVAGCCAVGIFGVISAGICFYKLQKSRKAAADVDYPAYGVTGPNKDLTSPNGDRKLAQSAQMYHYQHQKQQMIAVEKAGSTKNTSASDVDSEEENEEGDYTVYECPGLAPTGEMEVKNPLFHDDSTPVSPPVLPSKPDSNQN